MKIFVFPVVALFLLLPLEAIALDEDPPLRVEVTDIGQGSAGAFVAAIKEKIRAAPNFVLSRDNVGRIHIFISGTPIGENLAISVVWTYAEAGEGTGLFMFSTSGFIKQRPQSGDVNKVLELTEKVSRDWETASARSKNP